LSCRCLAPASLVAASGLFRVLDLSTPSSPGGISPHPRAIVRFVTYHTRTWKKKQ
jgi:hypothetical protein